MRILKFIADGQRLTKDPSCDFSGIVRGSKNYLMAHFLLSSEWTGRVIAASFWKLGKEYPVILKGNACMIPDDVLTWEQFKVSLTGMDRNKSMITTTKVTVRQEG